LRWEQRRRGEERMTKEIYACDMLCCVAKLAMQ
jgi:hypothetical protein